MNEKWMPQKSPTEQDSLYSWSTLVINLFYSRKHELRNPFAILFCARKKLDNKNQWKTVKKNWKTDGIMSREKWMGDIF